MKARLVLAALLLTAGAAVAQRDYSADALQRNQRMRIANGYAQGDLTVAETRLLLRDQRVIRRLDRVTDHRRRRHLDRRLDRRLHDASRRIYNMRHNQLD